MNIIDLKSAIKVYYQTVMFESVWDTAQASQVSPHYISHTLKTDWQVTFLHYALAFNVTLCGLCACV